MTIWSSNRGSKYWLITISLTYEYDDNCTNSYLEGIVESIY